MVHASTRNSNAALLSVLLELPRSEDSLSDFDQVPAEQRNRPQPPSLNILLVAAAMPEPGAADSLFPDSFPPVGKKLRRWEFVALTAVNNLGFLLARASKASSTSSLSRSFALSRRTGADSRARLSSLSQHGRLHGSAAETSGQTRPRRSLPSPGSERTLAGARGDHPPRVFLTRRSPWFAIL